MLMKKKREKNNKLLQLLHELPLGAIQTPQAFLYPPLHAPVPGVVLLVLLLLQGRFEVVSVKIKQYLLLL